MTIDILVGDRWSIIGATGSGKTVLSRELLKFYAKQTYRENYGFLVPIYILDTKCQGDFKFFEQKTMGKVVRGNIVPTPHMPRHQPFLVWQPEEDNFEMYNEFFKGIYQSAKLNHTPSIIYIDELSSIQNSLGKAPRYYDILLKQGRGMHNGVISVTQSPSFIPSNLLRQTTHAIRMHLNDDYDTKKLTKIMGVESLEPPEHDYGFWYRNCTKPIKKAKAKYFSDFKEFMGYE